MAGVGPTDNKFVFRYQYALCEIGSQVLRKLFDSKVGPDFKSYLDTSPSAIRKHFMFLLNSGKITPTQQNLLPPSEPKPKSTNFDITLLSCLLRNVCGLRRYDDVVWNNPPAASDTSVEANIVRLRILRNGLMHNPSVFMSGADLTSKWSELSKVLLDLNPSTGGIANLSSLIDNTKSMEIDEELKELHSDIIKAWREMDRLFDHGISEVLEGQKRLRNIVEERLVKPTESDDILRTLKDTYLREMTTVSVTPLFLSEQLEFLHFYQLPKMFVSEYHHSVQQTVYHHSLQQTEQPDVEVTTLEEIFLKNDTKCINIYLTGDAAVGKTSFCKFLCLMWAKSRSDIMDPSMQKYHDYLSHFDFVFYVVLRDTDRTDIVAAITDQLFYTENPRQWDSTYSKIKDNLNCERCLVIMDGYDEWTPKIIGKREPEIPCRVVSENSVYLTTCRPYKIENIRLLPKDLDHHVKMTGLYGSSSDVYVEKIVSYINSRSEMKRNYKDFLQEIEACDLSDLLRVPLTTTHLIWLWFRQPLTHMSRALIYGSIVQMLLQNACNKQTTSSLVQHLDSLMGLEFLERNDSSPLLRKLGMLSFRSLFKLNDSVVNLVFTREQLLSEPYCFSSEELDTVCKIGILSRNKVHGQYGETKQKINFQHLSFLEFFASYFVTTFDTNNDFDSIVNKWQTVNDILAYKQFLLFLAGFSAEKLKYVFDKTFSKISDDISTLCIRSIFCYEEVYLYWTLLKPFQTLVFTCIKETKNKEIVLLKVPHLNITEDSDIVTLKQLLLYNKKHIKSVYSENGVYFDELEQVESLEHISIDKVQTGYYDEFNQCMLKNKKTLNSIFIMGNTVDNPVLPELPMTGIWRPIPWLPITSHHKFDCLTTLYLKDIKLQHKHYDTLIQYLSCNVNVNNIGLISIRCNDHRYDDTDCTMTLDLSKHKKLTSLELGKVNILCCTSTHSNLQRLTLVPLSKSIVSCYTNIFNNIKNSNLKKLYCFGNNLLDINTMTTLTSCIKSLRYIKVLLLGYMNLSDMDILHPDTRDVDIVLYKDTIHSTAFNSFIDSISNNKCVRCVLMVDCKIILLHEESQKELSEEQSLEHIVKYVLTKSSLNISYKGELRFLKGVYKIGFYVDNP